MMRAVPALLLILLQLRPLAGAVVCLHNLATGMECPMPDHPDGSAPARAPAPPAPQAGHGIPGSGCPAADFCAPMAPAIAAVPSPFVGMISEHSIGMLFRHGLHSTEPAAPPAPPPNA